MAISKYTFIVGILLFVLSITQWNLHAQDGWIGETWDNEKQEKLYYCIAPLSAICLFATFMLGVFGL